MDALVLSQHACMQAQDVGVNHWCAHVTHACNAQAAHPNQWLQSVVPCKVHAGSMPCYSWNSWLGHLAAVPRITGCSTWCCYSIHEQASVAQYLGLQVGVHATPPGASMCWPAVLTAGWGQLSRDEKAFVVRMLCAGTDHMRVYGTKLASAAGKVHEGIKEAELRAASSLWAGCASSLSGAHLCQGHDHPC